MIDKTPAKATIPMNPFALIGALVRVVQRLLRPARSAAEVGIGAARDLTRARSELIAENALLRQQLIVLRRSIERPRLHRDDRVLLLLRCAPPDIDSGIPTDCSVTYRERPIGTWKMVEFLGCKRD